MFIADPKSTGAALCGMSELVVLSNYAAVFAPILAMPFSYIEVITLGACFPETGVRFGSRRTMPLTKGSSDEYGNPVYEDLSSESLVATGE